eukprot:468_1
MGSVNSHVHLKEHVLSNFYTIRKKQCTDRELHTSIFKMHLICEHWRRLLNLSALITPLTNTIIDYARVPFLFDKRRAPRGKNDYFYQLALIGDAAVGKSNIYLLRFFPDFDYRDDYEPTSTVQRCVRLGPLFKGTRVALCVYDCGADPPSSIKSHNRSLYKTTRGFLLVFDITNRDSLEYVKTEHKLLSAQQRNKRRAIVMLIGTKCDLEKEREVSIQQAQGLAKRLGCMEYMEVSAKENISIKRCFDNLVRAIYDMDQFVFDLNKPWMYPHAET